MVFCDATRTKFIDFGVWHLSDHRWLQITLPAEAKTDRDTVDKAPCPKAHAAKNDHLKI